MNAWTPEEESAFQKLMAAGHLERMPAIRLFRRCRCDLKKALALARTDAPAIARNKARAERTRATRLSRSAFIDARDEPERSQANAG